MSAMLLVILVAPPPRSEKPDRKTLIQASRQVLAALVEAARTNSKRKKPLTGDGLTTYYVRAAVAKVRTLPAPQRGWALAMALGVGLDRSSVLRDNFLTRFTWRQVETDAERKTRLDVLGMPTMHGRHDLAQHFFVSGALTALFGAATAESIGLTKEWLDSAPGGSGFSFADLAADLGGIELALRVLARRADLTALEKSFRVKDFCLAPKGLDEGLSRKAFETRFGSMRDDRFKKTLGDVRRQVRALPGFKK